MERYVPATYQLDKRRVPTPPMVPVHFSQPPMPRRLGFFCLLALLPLTACPSDSRATAEAPKPTFVGAVTLTPNDNPWVPQAAILSLATDKPTRVELRFTDPDRTWNVIASSGYATQHDRIPVVGMRPDREHSIQVTVRDQQGMSATWPSLLEFTTPPLPVDFPPIEVPISDPSAMEAGVTLLSLITANPGSMPIMLDAEGEVVWYLNCALSAIGTLQTLTAPLPNGNLMLVVQERLMIEVNMLGDILQAFSAARHSVFPDTTLVDVDSFHHEILALPPGEDADFAVLGTEVRELPDYPIDTIDPTQTTPLADVVGDEIVEFRRDGTVVRRIRLLDVLDPYRITYDTLHPFWNDHYGRPTYDWSHGNALVLDPRTNSWIVSLRHQDCVLQIGRYSGQVEWILGDPQRWRLPWASALLTPIGSNLEWPYHQHAPQLMPDGTIYLFDNGVARAIPPTPPLAASQWWSRAVQFRVDQRTRTVEQLWSYGSPPGSGPSFYSFFVSSAFHLPTTGNVLICDGGKIEPPNQLYAHIFEVTSEATPRRVFEVHVRGDGVTNTTSYFIYRAYRLPGLYQ